MIKTTKEKVKVLLTKYPALRDDNERLYINYLALCHNVDVLTVNLRDFFVKTDWTKVARFETVTRCSRTIQEKNEKLRGAEWLLRQKHQKKIKQELGYNS